MSARAVRSLLPLAAALALAGLGVAAYLTTVHYAGQPIACGAVGDCERVNSSRYAAVAGVPVALLGALAYAAMFVLVALAWLRASPQALAAAWGLALAAWGFSLYLTYVELRVIDAVCVYCVASASIVTALLATLSACAWLARADLLALDAPAP